MANEHKFATPEMKQQTMEIDSSLKRLAGEYKRAGYSKQVLVVDVEKLLSSIKDWGM